MTLLMGKWKRRLKSQNCSRQSVWKAIERSQYNHVVNIYANLLEATKESFYIEKAFNSRRIDFWHTNYGRRFIVLEHQYGRRDVNLKTFHREY